MDDNLFSSKEAAAILGVGERQIRRKAAKGQLTREMIEGKVYYRIPARTRPDIGPDVQPGMTGPGPDIGPGGKNEVETKTEVILRDSAQAARELARKYEQDLTRERGEWQQERQELKRQKFSLKLMGATATLVAIAAGGLLALGYGKYTGRLGELSALKANLQTTSETLNTERGRGDKLENEVDQVKSAAEIEARRLAAENERLQQERNQAIKDLADQINKSAADQRGGFWQGFLKAAADQQPGE